MDDLRADEDDKLSLLDAKFILESNEADEVKLRLSVVVVVVVDDDDDDDEHESSNKASLIVVEVRVARDG